MKCPKCQTENLADSTFCEECSAHLVAACPTCGAGNRPSAKFCRKCRAALAEGESPARAAVAAYTPKHLAEKILTSRSALEGERKRVTVLFADVQGSMELSERVDPEAWHRLMDRFFAILSDGVHRFEGTVNQYTGDGIMALFGAPIAHEDHAQRACFAALHLRDALQTYARELKREQGLQFSTRIGINSGEVVVGRIGDDLRMDYTAQGHTVGLAARMESLASPDTIYLTQATADLCTGYFDFQDLGEFNVKGNSGAVHVHQLTGVGPLRTRFDVSRARGLSRFVGRADEVDILEKALERSRKGQGQVVGVTLLEDLHWFDESSEAFLREWVDALQGGNGLLVLNFRPEYRADWMNATHYTQIALQPLGPEAIRELLADLLGRHPSTAGLADTIHERTRGNPFFTEEVVRALIEDGHLEGARGAYRLVTPVRHLQVPDTVHAILAARIDRLAERQKELLQTAAVIGKNFEEAILAAVANLPPRELSDSLAVLKSAEFVYEESLYPVVEYAFRHPLTHEVALQSQLAERRRKLHAAVAGAIEEQKAERLDEQAALIAHHWEQAGEALPAARWAARAAAWAARSDPAEGVRLRQLVLRLARQVAESEEAARLRMDACREILMGGSWRIGMPPEEVEALHDEAKLLAEARGDRDALASLAVAYVVVFGALRGDVAAYVREARRALPVVEENGDPELLASLLVMLGYSHFLNGRLVEALAYARRCEALGEMDPALGKAAIGFSAYLWSRMQVASAEAFGGDIQHGLRGSELVVRAAREAGEVEILGWALVNTVELLVAFAGELGDAPALAREALASSERVGSPFSQVHALARAVAVVQLFQGDFENAVGSLERALAIARERHTAIEREPDILAQLARAHLGRGDLARAATLAGEALAMARERGSRAGAIHALDARARALLARADAAEAGVIEALVEEIAALAEDTGMRLYLPQAVELRARVAGLRRDLAAQERHLCAAHRLYTEMGATGHAARLATELR